MQIFNLVAKLLQAAQVALQHRLQIRLRILDEIHVDLERNCVTKNPIRRQKLKNLSSLEPENTHDFYTENDFQLFTVYLMIKSTTGKRLLLQGVPQSFALLLKSSRFSPIIF